MHKLVILMARKPGLSPEAFRHHYETVHAPGARERIPALARAEYRRNYIAEAARPGRPAPDFDVVTEMVFASAEDLAAMRAASADPSIARWIADDLALFADPASVRSYVVDICASA